MSTVLFCALSLPDVSFVLIGPVRTKVPTKDLPPNVHFLGTRLPSEVPSYLRHATVGLIPFHFNRFRTLIDFISPLKLFEYFAAGLPVVSTRWNELESLDSPARLCDTREEFLGAVKQALVEPDQSKNYRSYAQAADWNRRTADLIAWANSK